MKKVMRNLFFLFVAGMLLAVMGETGSEAKTVKSSELKKGYSQVVYRVNQKERKAGGYVTIKKITARSNNKKVVSVKVFKERENKKKFYCVEITGKQWGNAQITVKVKKKMPSGKMRTTITKVKVNLPSNRQRAKEAFELQNRTRKSAGQRKLEWSEELYNLAITRVEKDGFDSHKNFCKRWDEYFTVNGIIMDELEWGSENLYIGSSAPADAIKGWKGSSGHYKNMIKSDWQCGAMAYNDKNNTWVAIFSEKPLSVIEDWRTKTPLLRFSRIDNITGERIRGSEISIVDDVGNEVYRGWSAYIFNSKIFTVGKIYTVIEKTAPAGYKKAASVTFVAKGASEGPIEIVLSSDRK